MNARPLLALFCNGLICLAAIAVGNTAGAAHAQGAAPTSTVGTPPMPDPMSWVGDPPSLVQPAVLPYIETPVATETLMNLHGIAFEDVNANGRRDAGEPAFSGAWFKLSGGGNWFVCGHAAGDGAFGLPVKAGAYHLQPVSMKGYRVTTSQVDVPAQGGPPALIGYVRDANAVGESCDAYHPRRPLK